MRWLCLKWLGARLLLRLPGLLRLPWLLYVARTIRLDEVFVVRRSVPGLSFAVDNGTTLHRVLLSTPRADELARELGG